MFFSYYFVASFVIFSVSCKLSNFKCNDSIKFQRCSLEVNNYVIDEIQNFIIKLRPKSEFQNIEFLDDRMSGSFWSLSLAEEWFTPAETNELVFSTVASEINGTSSSSSNSTGNNSSILVQHSIQKGKRKVTMSVHIPRDIMDSMTSNYIDIKFYGEWDDISVSDQKPLINWTMDDPDIFRSNEGRSSPGGYEDSLIILTVALLILVLGGSFFLAGTVKLRKAKKEKEEIYKKFPLPPPEDLCPSFHLRSHSLDSGSLENHAMKERTHADNDESLYDEIDPAYSQSSETKVDRGGPNYQNVDN